MVDNFRKVLAVFIFITSLAAVPVVAWAAINPFLPFGGRVVSSIPCLSAEGPSFWVTLIPFGLPGTIPPIFIWTPFTLSTTIPPVPSIPPTHIGEQILGTYTPGVMQVCFIGQFPVTGLRMLTENNSLPSGGF